MHSKRSTVEKARLALARRGAVFVLAFSATGPPSAWAQGEPRPSVTAPVVLGHVDAVYPPSALRERKHADVVLAVTVDVDGHVSKVDVLESGGADIDEAAVIATRQWTFVPAMRDQKPVASRIRVPFHFAPPAPPPELLQSPPTPPGELPVQPSVQPTQAQAASAPEATDAAARATQGTQEVNVYGRLDPRPRGASDYQTTLGELRAVPRANASDVLKLAPGFLLTNEGGSGHAEQVFVRGFDAHEGQDVEFSVDGVPINDTGNYHGNGYADTHFILPELIHSVRVLEGPYAPQQGNFAVAGSADYQLGLDRRGLTTEYSAGSFNTHRLLLLFGPSDAPTGTFAGAEYYTTDGFGANRQAKRATAMAQFEAPLGQAGTLRVNASAYATAFNNAGVIREDDYDYGKVGFFGTEDPNQTGNTATRAGASATYEGRFKEIDVSQQLFVVDRAMRLRENWTGFLLDVQQPTQQPHAQRGDLIDFHFDEVSVGARGFARWHGRALGLRQEFEAGYFARIDQTNSTQYRVAAGSGTPYGIDADLTSTLGDVGVYVDGNANLFRWLGVRGGVRADTFLFDVLDHCAVHSVDSPSRAVAAAQIDVSCLSQLEHGVYREPFQRKATGNGSIMPRGTLVVGPFDRFEVTASLGGGVRSVDPSYVSQGIGTPFVSAQSRDLGVSYAQSLAETMSLSVKSDFFQTHVDQDLLFNPTQGRNTLAGGSTRTGWSGAVRAAGKFFDLAANATVVKATFDATGACSPYCGLSVPYVPDVVLRGDLALFLDLPWTVEHKAVRATAGYGVSYVGRRPLPYGDFSDIVLVSDASIGLGWSIWNVRMAGQNIFDSLYRLGEYNYASDFRKLLPAPTLVPERSFTAGAPRTILFSISVTLGGA